MTTMDRIRNAFNRVAHVYGKRPEAARIAATMRARIVDGLRCEAQEDNWRFVVDMPVDVGGGGQGPTPGTHGRAALASCLAIGYAMYLARAGIVVRDLLVEVQTDIDYRGLFGFEDVNPGYGRVHHTLFLDCDAEPAVLEPVLAASRRASPYLRVFGEPQPLSGQTVLGPIPPR
jgi:uncharacterized OsmC-like protein